MRRGVTPTSHVSGFLTVIETHPENKVVTKSGDWEVNLGLGCCLILLQVIVM